MPTSNAKSLLIIIVLMLQATSWAAPANPCQPVHDAYSKMLSTPHKNVETNSGAMNVTKAFGIITSEEFDDSCKYLRDESLDGELMSTAKYSNPSLDERMACCGFQRKTTS